MMHWQLAHYFKAILLFAVPSKEIVVGYDCLSNSKNKT